MNSTKQQFVKFLKDNNVYEQYMFNFKEHRIKRKQDVPRVYYAEKVFFLNCNCEYFIRNAFPWKCTPQGGYYWANIDTKWIDYLNYN